MSLDGLNEKYKQARIDYLFFCRWARITDNSMQASLAWFSRLAEAIALVSGDRGTTAKCREVGVETLDQHRVEEIPALYREKHPAAQLLGWGWIKNIGKECA